MLSGSPWDVAVKASHKFPIGYGAMRKFPELQVKSKAASALSPKVYLFCRIWKQLWVKKKRQICKNTEANLDIQISVSAVDVNICLCYILLAKLLLWSSSLFQMSMPLHEHWWDHIDTQEDSTTSVTEFCIPRHLDPILLQMDRITEAILPLFPKTHQTSQLLSVLSHICTQHGTWGSLISPEALKGDSRACSEKAGKYPFWRLALFKEGLDLIQ